jgi:hypothetical protein
LVISPAPVDHVEPVAIDLARDVDLDGNAITSEATDECVSGFLLNIVRIVVCEDADADNAWRHGERLEPVVA